jgi:hypothetical protein
MLLLLLLLLLAPDSAAEKLLLPRPWVAPTPRAIAVQTGVDRAIAAGLPSFTLPSEEIHFNSAPFNITAARGIRIGGSGNTLLVFCPGVGVSITNSSQSALHSLTIDYSPLPCM